MRTTRRLFALALLPFAALARVVKVNHATATTKMEDWDVAIETGPSFTTSDVAKIKEMLLSFDARVWARFFVETVQKNPGVATDEATMTGWFANALNRGYNEREYGLRTQCADAARSQLDGLSRTAIAGAVGRGWRADANRYKEMDVNLAHAITDEIMALKGPRG